MSGHTGGPGRVLVEDGFKDKGEEPGGSETLPGPQRAQLKIGSDYPLNPWRAKPALLFYLFSCFRLAAVGIRL